MLTLLLGVIALSACSGEEKVNDTSDIISTPDSGYRVENFEKLIAGSDLIVIGTVDKVHPASLRDLSADKSNPINVVYTLSDIRMEQIVLGTINQSSQNIFTVKQAGGLYKDKVYTSTEPILEEGKTYLFFLHTYDILGAPDEPYTLVGGEEAIVTVEDGMVKFHPSLALTGPLTTKLIKDETSTDHGVALKIDDVIAEIIRINNNLSPPDHDVDLE